MTLKFERAQASHLDAVVPLIYSSGPAAFDFVFRTKRHTAQEYLRRAFADGAGEFGWRNHTVVMMDDVLVGVGAAFSGDTGLAFTLVAARQILGLYGLEGAGVIRRGLQIEHVIQPPNKGTQYIAHLGVAPTMQSRGIGAQLVEHFIAEGKAKGSTFAALDVAVDNPRAQKLYERLGFVVTTEHVSHLANQFGTVVNVRRMERKIS